MRVDDGKRTNQQPQTAAGDARSGEQRSSLLLNAPPRLPHGPQMDTVMLGTRVHLGNVGEYGRNTNGPTPSGPSQRTRQLPQRVSLATGV